MNENKINILAFSGSIRAGKDTAARIVQYLTQGHNEISLEQMLALPPLEQPQTTPWQIKKFAGKLKECVSLVTGISLEDLEKQDVKASFLTEEWNKNIPDLNYPGDMTIAQMTVREMLQQFGTQGGRAIHPDFWVNALFSDYKPTLTGESKSNLLGFLSRPKQFRESVVEYKLPKWIISDVRFPNEVAAIESRGGIVINIFRNIDTIDQERGPAYDETKHASETGLNEWTPKYSINNNYGIQDLVDSLGNLLHTLEII